MTDDPSPLAPNTSWQLAKIIEIVQRTRRIRSFVLKLPEPFTYQAGQHVDLRLTAPDGYRAMRSYSIASAPDSSNRIEVAIELLERGEVSPFFHKVAEVGDDIELRGPLGGHFVWSVADGGPVLMLGGGSGIVPLMSMIRHRCAAASSLPAMLLLSAPRWDDVLYRDELFEIDRRKDGFMFVMTLTREPSRREGDYGRRVDRAMMAELLARLPCSPQHIFICGSNAFANAAADGVIAAGTPASLVRTERYGP